MDPVMHNDSGKSEIDSCGEEDRGNCQGDDVAFSFPLVDFIPIGGWPLTPRSC
jgi:hypothetical protein